MGLPFCEIACLQKGAWLLQCATAGWLQRAVAWLGAKAKRDCPVRTNAGERHRRLEKLGMAWQGRNCLRELWETRYAQLVAFKKKYGHCDVVCLWKENPALGHWVSNQRVCRKKGKLSNERIARLNKLGFRWGALFDKNAPPECFRPMVDASERLWNSNFASLERPRLRCPLAASLRTIGRVQEALRPLQCADEMARRSRLRPLGFQSAYFQTPRLVGCGAD